VEQDKAIAWNKSGKNNLSRTINQKEILKLRMLKDIPLSSHYETASEELQRSMALEIKNQIFKAYGKN
jgi:hypothetical protein